MIGESNIMHVAIGIVIEWISRDLSANTRCW